MTEDEHEERRLNRRGHQLLRAALEMEAGQIKAAALASADMDTIGPEALITLTDAISRCLTLVKEPRDAVDTVVQILDAIDFTNRPPKPQTEAIVSHQGDLLAELALEMALGKKTNDKDTGRHAAQALRLLADAIVYICALNSNPRQIIEHVVQALDEADVVTARKRHQQ